jgi:hypothetical protein
MPPAAFAVFLAGFPVESPEQGRAQ